MNESLVSKFKLRVNPTSFTCPKCNNKATLTDFGSKGLCGTCRHVWPVLDKFLKNKSIY